MNDNKRTAIVNNTAKYVFPTFNDAIIDDYCIRLMNETDYQSISDICTHVYGGNDYVSESFYRLLNDNKSLFFCCEHIPTKNVIGCQIIKIMDNGHTGFEYGWRMNPNYRSKGIFSKFSEYTQKWKYKHLKCIRYRTTTLSPNKASIHISKKSGFIIRDKLYSFTNIVQGNVSESTFDTIKNTPSICNQNIFEQKLKEYGSHKYNETINEITNVGLVLDLLKKYGKKELHLNWKIYDLIIDNQSLKECYDFLYNEWNDGRLKIFTYNNNNAFGLLYKDERKRINEINIYGNNENDILSILYQMFIKWKIKYQNYTGQVCRIFMDNDDIKNSEKLSKLLEGTIFMITTEKYIQ